MSIIDDYKKALDVTTSYRELLSKTESPVAQAIHISEEVKEAERSFQEYYKKILKSSLEIPYPSSWLSLEEFLVEPHNVLGRLNNIKRAIETTIKDLEAGKETTKINIILTKDEDRNLRIYEQHQAAEASAKIKEVTTGKTTETEQETIPQRKKVKGWFKRNMVWLIPSIVTGIGIVVSIIKYVVLKK